MRRKKRGVSRSHQNRQLQSCLPGLRRCFETLDGREEDPNFPWTQSNNRNVANTTTPQRPENERYLRQKQNRRRKRYISSPTAFFCLLPPNFDKLSSKSPNGHATVISSTMEREPKRHQKAAFLPFHFFEVGVSNLQFRAG